MSRNVEFTHNGIGMVAINVPLNMSDEEAKKETIKRLSELREKNYESCSFKFKEASNDKRHT